MLAFWTAASHDLQIKKSAFAQAYSLEHDGRFDEAIAAIDSAIDATWFFNVPALKEHRAALRFRATRPEVFGPHARDHGRPRRAAP
jgi:hypothetical protein